MNDHKPDREREAKPSKGGLDRPDNGSRERREQGPNSGPWKDNPHRNQVLARHAGVAH